MIYAALYLGCILGANWALATFGVIPILPGVYAPAGVFFAGLSFTVRDRVQDQWGRRGVLLLIVLGSLLSALLSPQFAIASASAFFLSELADQLVYTPLRARFPLRALVLSNVVGLTLDSVLFLLLAFGSLDNLLGQVVGKLLITALSALVWGIRHQHRQRQA